MGGGAAAAGEPAAVTVRAVGSDGRSLLGLAQVTTDETPVVKDGDPEHSCAGTSAAGALQLASKGEWGGGWSEGFGYGVETIAGVSLPSSGQNRWEFWLNDQPVPPGTGVCGAGLHAGDSVLFFAQCVSKEAGVCPPVPPGVLAIEAPTTVEAKQPVTVTVLSYPNAGGTPVPAQGVTVAGGGDLGVPPTDAQGQTTLTFAGDGNYTIEANGSSDGPPAIPAEAVVCAHEGNDGRCGTPAPPGPAAAQPSGEGGSPAPVTHTGVAPPATSSVALTATTVTVWGGSLAEVKLECLGIASCHGKLTLTAKNTVRAKGKGTARTVRIGTASFSIGGDEAKTVKINLNAAARSLLRTAHGRLNAINADPALSLVGDLANLDKHATIDAKKYPPKTGHVPTIGAASGSGSTSGEGWRLNLPIVHNGRTLDGLTVAQQAVDAWRGLLTGWGLARVVAAIVSPSRGV